MGRIWTRPRTPVAAQLLRGNIKLRGQIRINQSNAIGGKFQRFWLGRQEAVARDVWSFDDSKPLYNRDENLLTNDGTVGITDSTLSVDGGYTIVARVKHADTVGAQILFPNSGHHYGLFWTGSSLYHRPESPSFYTTSSGRVANEWNTWIFVRRGEGDGQLWRNHAALSMSITGSDTDDFSTEKICSPGWPIDCEIEFIGIADQAFSDADVHSFVSRPYQVIKPANDRVFLYPVAAPAASIAPQHFHHRHISRAG